MPPEAPKPKYPLDYPWFNDYEDIVRVFPHETLLLYVQGGFHPVAIGDSFHNGRYTVRYKIGHGGYSTVWVARDNEAGRWTSLKIKKAYVSTESLDHDKEIRALRILQENHVSSNSSNPPCFALLLDSFQHHGPNGTHTCIVTELLGPSISGLVENFNCNEGRFWPDTILRASKQLLQGIHMVKESGIVHGDISPRNVVFTCKRMLENDDEKDLDELWGDPIIAEYTGTEPLPDHLPKHLVAPTDWYGWADYSEEDVRLIDWGESFSGTETAITIAQPANLKSPETFFIGSLDYHHDLWRIGCVIYTMFYQREPFGWAGCDAMQIEIQARIIGSLPPQWHTRWQEITKESPKYCPLREFILTESCVSMTGFLTFMIAEHAFEPLGQSFEPRRLVIMANTEKGYCKKKRDIMEDDYEALSSLLSVIQGLMQHEPQKRSSAQEAAAKIQWHDHWRDLVTDETDESEDDGSTESEEDQESDS